MKTRILQLGKFNLYYKGGIEKVVSKIHNQLSSKYSIFTIYLDKYNSKKRKIFSSKINFNLNSFYFSHNYISKVFQLRNKFDLFIGHMPNPLCIILLLMPKKYILFWHSDIINKNFILKFIYRPIELLLILFAKKIIFTSKEYYETSYAKIFSKPYAIIPLSTDRRLAKKKIFSKKLLSVGRLVSYKNYFFLLKVMSKIPQYSLTIVGDGPDYLKIKKYIAENNIINVFIKRKISNLELSNIYDSHDIFCLASNTRAEAFGIVLIEALSFGLPILVGKNEGSGMLSICENNYNGFSFNYETDDFKKKLDDIEKNFSFFSENALKSFKKKYTDQDFIDNISSAITLAK